MIANDASLSPSDDLYFPPAPPRSPPSLATLERPGSRADYGKLAAFALAELCDSLGCPCAAIVARIAQSPEEWFAVAKTVRGMAHCEWRKHDVKAGTEAACSLFRDEPIEAALTLSRLNGEELSDWHARVTQEMASARTERSSKAHAHGSVSL